MPYATRTPCVLAIVTTLGQGAAAAQVDTHVSYDKRAFLEAAVNLGRSPEQDTAVLNAIVGSVTKPTPDAPFGGAAGGPLRHTAQLTALGGDRIVLGVYYMYYTYPDGDYSAHISFALNSRRECIGKEDIARVFGPPTRVSAAKGSHIPIGSEELHHSKGVVSGTFTFLARPCAYNLDINTRRFLEAQAERNK